MLGFIFMASFCWALVNCGVETPTLQSMTFSMETVDRIDDFSIRSTTYFSEERNMIRLDLNEGSNFVFIDKEQNENYYFYPMKNTTACWKVRMNGYLVNPLLNVFSYPYFGQEQIYDTHAEKYELREIQAFDQKETLTEIWVMKHDPETGINNRPIRKVVKQWQVDANKTRLRDSSHIVTTYFGFSVGEPPSSVWDRPIVECLQADSIDESTIIDLILSTTDINFDSPLIEYSMTGHEKKMYSTGRNAPKIHFHSFNPPKIVLEFPYTKEEIASISKTLPKSFDWRHFGAVTPVKDQRHCGSCWTFGTVGSLEGAYFRKYNKLVELSEQAMMDCAGASQPNNLGLGSNGCYGGLEYDGFLWVNVTGGIPPAGEYPLYQEMNGKCRVTDSTTLVAPIKGFFRIPNNTEAVQVALVELGPLSVGISADPIQGYTNGIVYSDDSVNTSTDINHNVLLVGYGENDMGDPYWIVKNSWGIGFGLNGYFLLSANGNCLNILDEVSFPVLK